MSVTYNGAYAHVGANTGIRATWDPLGTAPTSPYWISQSFSNQLWAQVGYYPPGWFWYVFDLKTNPPQILAHSKLTNPKPIQAGQSHVFEISLQGNRWRFMVDGKAVGNYGIGSDTGSGDFLLTNEFTNGTESALFSDAMVQLNGVWQPASSASAYISGTPAIGIAGHLQDPTLASGSLRIGGAASVTNGTQLW